MSFYMKRVRTRDKSADHELGHPSKVGQVRYSKQFRTQGQAQREADAWQSTGDYKVSVYEGKAPADKKGQRS